MTLLCQKPLIKASAYVARRMALGIPGGGGGGGGPTALVLLQPPPDFKAVD